MRIDQFLSSSRLIGRRAEAKRACDEGLVFLDGRRAKPGDRVKSGQIVSIKFWDRRVEAEILEIPQGNVSRKRARTLCRLTEEEGKEPA